MDKETSKAAIAALVEKFREAEAEGRARKLNEEATKKAFIEPLFSALGWDMSDDREVTLEERISGERADYGFYIEGRIQFYVEAKSVKSDLNDEKFANQAISYAWNKGVEWAVLTDFEGIKIFNTQDMDASLASKRFKTISWDEYLDRFEELWLLSKPAWQERLLDGEAEKAGKKLERVSVTSKLYEDLNAARELLSESFLLWNRHLQDDPVLLDEGVQKILDRLIFIRVAEDRGIEQKTLRPLVREWSVDWYEKQKRDKYLYQSMMGKFAELNEIYNSNIFAQHPSDEWVDEKNRIQDIIELLYGREGYYEYNFSVIPADILGTVYEQYLGHKLSKAEKGDLFGSKDLKLAKDSKKRKEHGIYYTPQFVVDYIVENTLTPLLEKCKSIADLQKIKVLDPACGSGSFLIKALEVIYKKYESFGRSGQYTKLDILVNNLYGVDLDDQAVEIARLNLLLAALESRQKMPNLDNIKVGNTLLSGTEAELEKKFGKDWRDKKRFNWKEEFSAVFNDGGFDAIIGNPPYIKEDTNKSAFDGLHDSPYYQGKMDIWTMFASISIDFLKDHGVLGLIAPNNWVSNAGASRFREKILSAGKLLKFFDFGDFKVFEHASIQTMIFIYEKGVPPAEYSLEYTRVEDRNTSQLALASLMRGHAAVIQIDPTKLKGEIISFNSESDTGILAKIKSKSNFQLLDTDVGNGIDVLQDFVAKSHLPKLAAKGVQKGSGILVLTDDEVKKIRPTAAEKQYLRPYYSTEQIGRYLADVHSKYHIIYANTSFRENINKYPNIKKHIDQFAEIMTSAYAPYGLHRAREERLFEGEGIFAIRKTKKPAFAYVNFPCYVTRAFLVIKPKGIDLKYLTGVLNSSVIAFWLRNKGKLQGDQLQIDKEPLLTIPIHVGTDSEQVEIIRLVEQISDLTLKLRVETMHSEKWNRYQAEMHKIDSQIDEKVCSMYGVAVSEMAQG